MIKSVTVTNDIGEAVTMTIGEVEPYSGLLITSIEGLGPVKADVNMSNLATMDGSRMTNVRANGRNIVLHLRYLDVAEKSIEDVRIATYKYFPLKKKVTFHIETDNRVAEAYGYVESNEPDIFSEAESATVSILCEGPWFYAAGDDGTQNIPFSNVTSLFEFEFSDDNSPSIVFSELEKKSEKIINYKGEAETGFVMHIYASDRFYNVTIYNNRTRDYFQLFTYDIEEIIGRQIKAGDEIVISTVKNDKYVIFKGYGSSVQLNLLNAVSKTSTWLTLQPGDNSFSYTCDDSAGVLNIDFVIDVQILYQGV